MRVEIVCPFWYEGICLDLCDLITLALHKMTVSGPLEMCWRIHSVPRNALEWVMTNKDVSGCDIYVTPLEASGIFCLYARLCLNTHTLQLQLSHLNTQPISDSNGWIDYTCWLIMALRSNWDLLGPDTGQSSGNHFQTQSCQNWKSRGEEAEVLTISLKDGEPIWCPPSLIPSECPTATLSTITGCLCANKKIKI